MIDYNMKKNGHKTENYLRKKLFDTVEDIGNVTKGYIQHEGLLTAQRALYRQYLISGQDGEMTA